MNKEQFLAAVRQRRAGLPQSDIDRFLDYYAEMIDDRMEDGLSEGEAVAAMGTPEYVASQILMDTPLPKLVKAKTKASNRLNGWEVLLLVLGAPVWLPLGFAALIVILSLCITVCAVLFSLFISVFAIGISGIACIGSGIGGLVFTGLSAKMVALTGAGLLLTGVAILLFLAFRQAVKGIVWGCKWGVRKVKSWFVKKGDPQ